QASIGHSGAAITCWHNLTPTTLVPYECRRYFSPDCHYYKPVYLFIAGWHTYNHVRFYADLAASSRTQSLASNRPAQFVGTTARGRSGAQSLYATQCVCHFGVSECDIASPTLTVYCETPIKAQAARRRHVR